MCKFVDYALVCIVSVVGFIACACMLLITYKAIG